MFVNKDNQGIIGTQLKCHDSLITDFDYNLDQRSLNVQLSPSPFSNVGNIVFDGILACTITGFEPWGHDNYIFDWQYLNPEDSKAFLRCIFNITDGIVNINIDELICSEIVFASGDRIRIICQSIQVTVTG